MVREAKVEDARALAELHVRASRAAYSSFLPEQWLVAMSVGQRERAWREVLTERGALGFVSLTEREGAIVGLCSMALPSRDDDLGERAAEIASLYVDPPRWLTGIGRELLEDAIGRLHRRDWDELTLWVFKRNVQARDFYTHFGLRLDGLERLHASGQPEVRMRVSL